MFRFQSVQTCSLGLGGEAGRNPGEGHIRYSLQDATGVIVSVCVTCSTGSVTLSTHRAALPSSNFEQYAQPIGGCT